MAESNDDYFSFIRSLERKKLDELVQYIVNPSDNANLMPEWIAKSWMNQILVLRGALGYGIFEHCLSMRCGVEYGVPDKFHKKKIAVPYTAADIPSRTS